MFQIIVRSLLVLVCSATGYFVVSQQNKDITVSLIGLILGLLVALFVMQIEQAARKLSLRVIFGGIIGTVIGLLIAYLLACGLRFIPDIEKQTWLPWKYIYALLTFILGYLGLVLGSKKSEEFTFPGFPLSKSTKKSSSDYRILDTSVIIDGRIADICDTGFFEGSWVVPKFVLGELQQIADSSDSIKRAKGRRGLDILSRMQKSEEVRIDILDTDFSNIRGVDEKLVALAKKRNGKIVTNDYNLNKVAGLQGIKVLNINELANALKPMVLPGEVMNTKIIREGKEHGQGVAYLDDGTMIIVDNGIKYVGQDVQVVATSVLQTAAGRMVFANLKDNDQKKTK